MVKNRRLRLLGHELVIRAQSFGIALFFGAFMVLIFRFTASASSDSALEKGIAAYVFSYLLSTLILLLVLEGARTFTQLRLELEFQQARRRHFTRTVIGRLVYAAVITLLLFGSVALVDRLAAPEAQPPSFLALLLHPSPTNVPTVFLLLLCVLTVSSLVGHWYFTGRRPFQILATALLVLLCLCPILFIPEIEGKPLLLVLLEKLTQNAGSAPLFLRFPVMLAIFLLLLLAERSLLVRQEQQN